MTSIKRVLTFVAMLPVCGLCAAGTAGATTGPSASRSPRFPRVTIPVSPGAIRVDGRLDDSAWHAAAMITGFMRLRKKHVGHHQARVYLTYDDRFLYLGTRSPIHRAKPLVANVTERDGDVWPDDCIEVFLDPTPTTPDFYQFAINSRGAVVDMGYHLRPGQRHDRTWNLAGLRCQARVDKHAWTLEAAFPYAGFGVPRPTPGTRWLLNVCESRVSLGYFSICTLRLGYAEHDRFGCLTFGGDCPAVRVEDFGPLESGVLKLRASYHGRAAHPVEAVVRASRYDETANTHFPLFSQSGPLGPRPRVVVTADPRRLGSHGTLDVSIAAGASKLYETRLAYRVLTRVAIQTMRRVHTDRGWTLRVTTVQPPSHATPDRRVRVRILSTGKTVVRDITQAITGNRMDVPVDLGGLKPGAYRVGLELVDGKGRVISKDTQRELVVYPDPPPWRGNTLGISDRVPPPWTPLVVDQSVDGCPTVRCWNRQYRFGPGSLLPVSIRSGGTEYLQTPIGVAMTLAGTKVSVGKVTHRVAEQTPRRCRIESTCPQPRGALRASTTIDFDGFIWVDLIVQPGQVEGRTPMVLDELAVVWDMPPRESRLLNTGYRSLAGTGATPPKWAKRLDGAFWVGNEYGGISFAVESRQHWSNRDPHRQAAVTRTDKGTRVAIHVVDKPIAVRAQRIRYGFAFHPTPVRARPRGYRKTRECSWMGTHHMRTPYPVTVSFWNATWKYMGAPAWWTSDADIQAHYRQRNRRYVPRVHTFRGLKESGARSTWYATYSHTARNMPEFVWFGQLWRCGSRDRLYGNTLYGYKQDMVAVCKTKDYADWYLWRFDNSRREDPLIDGIYFDLMHWHPCNREDHGHGYVDATGKRRSTVQIRGHRRWLLRIYTYLKEKDPATPIMSHLSGHNAYMMGHAFCDYIWDGELWVREVQRDLSYENLELDTFRAETMCSAYGPQILWLNQLGRALTFLTPQERKKRKLKPYAGRHALAMQFVHDIIPGGSNRFHAQTIRLWQILDRFGLDDADRLLPYWEDDTGIALVPRDKNIVASAYVKSDRALVFVFNNTDAHRPITVRIDRHAVFGPGDKRRLVFRDPETEGQKPLAAGHSVTLPIGKRDFRVLWVNLEGGS